MRSSFASATLAAAAVRGALAQANFTTGALGNASAITDNTAGASYVATLPDEAFAKSAYPSGGNAKGSVQAVSSPNGVGVLFRVTFSNLPAQGGPFKYHLHDQPVPEDGNCTKTLAHLDPYQRGETPPCDPKLPETCQVGDLSGKHGMVEIPAGSDTFTAIYVDNYASTVDGIGAFFGNRSFVLHFGNTTRISCANFVAVQASSNSCDGSVSSTTPSHATANSSHPTHGANSSAPKSTPTPAPTVSAHPNNGTPASPPVVVAAGSALSVKMWAMLGAAGLALLL